MKITNTGLRKFLSLAGEILPGSSHIVSDEIGEELAKQFPKEFVVERDAIVVIDIPVVETVKLKRRK